jgi:hypothetical protein
MSSPGHASFNDQWPVVDKHHPNGMNCGTRRGSISSMLRTHSQHNGRKLVDIAEAIVDSHLLLLPPLVQSPVDGRGTSPAGVGITA